MLLQDKALDLTLSISVTTRARRSSEVDGIHYHFIDRAAVRPDEGGGDLLEAAEVHGNGYGTPRKPVEEVLAQGRDMLFDIDWQGARQVREALGERRRQRLHPAAVDGGAARPAGAPRRGFGRHHRQAARQRQARDRALAALRLCRRQRRSAARLSRRSSRSSTPSGRAARASPRASRASSPSCSPA